MKLILWIIILCFLCTSSFQMTTESLVEIVTTVTIKSAIQTTTKTPTTTLDCNIEEKDIPIESCKLKGSSIACGQPSANPKYTINFTVSPNVKRSNIRYEYPFPTFSDIIEGQQYKVSACAQKSWSCSTKCRHMTIRREVHINEDVFTNISSSNDSIVIDCSGWSDRMLNATYLFHLSGLTFNQSVIWPARCLVTFDDLTSGTYYNATVYGVAIDGSSTPTISRVLVTTPEISLITCKSDLHSLTFRVDDIGVNDYFNKSYQGSRIEQETGELKMTNLEADTIYNVTVKLVLGETDSKFKNKLRVESNSLEFSCQTKLEEPRVVWCPGGGFKFQKTGLSSGIVTFPYSFSDENGKVEDLVLVLRNDGDYFKKYSLKSLIPRETCAPINYTLINLSISEYTAWLEAYNRMNESSASEQYTFEISIQKGLVIALVIISIILVVVVLILLCQCGLFGRRRKVRISKTSTSFTRFIASRARTMKKLSHRMSHHPVVRAPISASDFPAHVDTLEKDSGLIYSEEFDDLKNIGRNQTTEDALLQCNRPKNRFVNILPFDNTRVKLQSIDDDEGSDYINANWIPGYHSKREFIATQGPLISTMDDFWRLVWEHNCPAIVMLTLLTEKNKLKCEQYWPVENTTTYGELQVTLSQESAEEKRVLKEFTMKNSKNDETKTVKHFHYLEWPDMNVPEIDSLLSFVFFIRENLTLEREAEEAEGPVIVHCSAGVGRSGTFIALDTLLNQLEYGNDLDIYGTVAAMRMNRVLMVQTEQQYIFLYRCIREVIEKSLVTNHIISSASCILQIHESDTADTEVANPGENGINKTLRDMQMANDDHHYETMIISIGDKNKWNENSIAHMLNEQSLKEEAVTEFIVNSRALGSSP